MKNGFLQLHTYFVTTIDFKDIEKIVHDQIIDYLAQYDISHKYQSSIRTKHSNDLYLS